MRKNVYLEVLYWNILTLAVSKYNSVAFSLPDLINIEWNDKEIKPKRLKVIGWCSKWRTVKEKYTGKCRRVEY